MLLEHLDVIDNEAIHISSEVFETTPVKNVNILCNEPELKLRRCGLGLK